MTRLALILLAALAIPSPEATIAKRGPPLICYPIEIGSAKSLPWGKGPVDADPTVSVENVAQDTLRILAESNDVLVHMETLRRAYFYLQSRPDGGMAGHDPPSVNLSKFGTMLKDSVLEASVPDPMGKSRDPRREALAWFDLGYLLAIKENGLHGRDLVRDVSCHRILERAAALGPDDAGLRFGVAFGQINNYVEGYDAKEWPQTAHWHDRGRQHLGAAMDLTKDQQSLLAKNICALFADNGPYGSPTTFDELRKRIAPETRPR
jgi:hypothetical protein